MQNLLQLIPEWNNWPHKHNRKYVAGAAFIIRLKQQYSSINQIRVIPSHKENFRTLIYHARFNDNEWRHTYTVPLVGEPQIPVSLSKSLQNNAAHQKNLLHNLRSTSCRDVISAWDENTLPSVASFNKLAVAIMYRSLAILNLPALQRNTFLLLKIFFRVYGLQKLPELFSP